MGESMIKRAASSLLGYRDIASIATYFCFAPLMISLQSNNRKQISLYFVKNNPINMPIEVCISMTVIR